MTFIPRIRGKVGLIETPEEWKGKYAFTIWMSELGKPFEEDKPVFGPHGPYDTEDEAHDALTEGVKIICEKFEKDTTGNFSGEYIDMKDNTRKKFQ